MYGMSVGFGRLNRQNKTKGVKKWNLKSTL